MLQTDKLHPPHTCLEGQSWEEKSRGSFVNGMCWRHVSVTISHWNQNFSISPFWEIAFWKLDISIKNYFDPKKYLEDPKDVKLNFRQLLFSTPSPFSHSLRSYWALKCLENIWPKIFGHKILLFLKLNNFSGSGKINLV